MLSAPKETGLCNKSGIYESKREDERSGSFTSPPIQDLNENSKCADRKRFLRSSGNLGAGTLGFYHRSGMKDRK